MTAMTTPLIQYNTIQYNTIRLLVSLQMSRRCFALAEMFRAVPQCTACRQALIKGYPV